MPVRSKKRKWRSAAKWAQYALMLILAGVLQATPGFFQIGQAKPVWILAVCLCVALYEGEFKGALFGAVGGILWEAASGRIIGFFAILMLICLYLASCVWQVYLRDSFVNYLWLCALIGLVILSIDFLVSWLLPGYPDAASRYLWMVLPTAALTAVCGLPFRLWARKASRLTQQPAA